MTAFDYRRNAIHRADGPEPMPAERLAEIRAHASLTAQAFGTVGLSEAEADREDLLAEVDRLYAQMAIVEDFLAERAEFVTTLRQCVEADEDYWRWQGHAEARRVLSERLGLPVGWPPEDAAKAARRAQQDGGETS